MWLSPSPKTIAAFLIGYTPIQNYKFKRKKTIYYLLSCCCCSVAKPCPTLHDPIDCSIPGFPHRLPESAQVHVHWISDVIQLSHPLPSITPSIRVFYNESAVRIRWPSIRASASVSVLPKSIQDWFTVRLTGLFLLSKGLSRVFSSTTVQKHQFFGALPSLSSSSHICTQLIFCNFSYNSIFLII